MEREGSGRRIPRLNGYLFAILIVGLVSATLHYAIQIWNNARDSSTSPPDNTMTSEQFLRSLPLPVRFPGYFRSPEEQKLAEERLLSRPFVPAPNGSEDGLVNTCTGVCLRPSDWKPLSPSTINHACCVSYSSFVSPTWVIDIITQKNKTLATFEGKKQFFAQENCIQVNGCNTCKCQTQTTYATAVVYTDDKTDYEISWFSLPGCCKCINT